MGAIGWFDRPKPKGLATYLEFRYGGGRHRPLLGYDLDGSEKARRAALMAAEIMRAIDAGEVPAAVDRLSATTLNEFAKKEYYPSLKRRNRVDLKRPQQIVEHLAKHFRSLNEIELTAINAYMDKRKKEGAAGGTIRKEMGVLSRICSLAIAHKIISINPCDSVELPNETKRKRVVTGEELRIMRENAKTDLWRVILLALVLSLRRGKILAIEASWIRKHTDGNRWLYIPEAASRLKGTPEAIPLNKLAVWALTSVGLVVAHGKIFRRWKRARVC